MPRKPSTTGLVRTIIPPVVEPLAPTNNRNITNCLPGTQLHLGDGRVLEFGENAEVGEELAAFLRERGQAQ